MVTRSAANLSAVLPSVHPPQPKPITLTATTTLKAKALHPERGPSSTVTVGFTEEGGFHPASVAGLALWLRADAGVPSGAGDYWADQSGTGNDAGQASGAKTPRLVQDAVNGLPAMRFDGQDDVVQLTTRLVNVQTVFWVVKEDPAASSGRRPLLGDGGTRDFYAGSGDPGTLWYGACCENYQYVVNGQTWLNGLPVDGTDTTRPEVMSVISLVTTGPTRADRFGGGWAQQWWWGDLAELVIGGIGPVELAHDDYVGSVYR